MTHNLISYAGGKFQLSQDIIPWFPQEFDEYWEPFCGGISVFKRLVDHYGMDQNKAHLSDLDSNLMNMYDCVQTDPERFARHFQKYEKPHSRDAIQSLKDAHKSVPKGQYARAARFMYLLRYVRSGIPKRIYYNSISLSMNHLQTRSIFLGVQSIYDNSKLLEGVDLSCKDFEDIKPKAYDLIYLDPPYYAVDSLYRCSPLDHDIFLYRQKMMMDRCTMIGAYCYLSNADVQEVREMFKSYNINVLSKTYSTNKIKPSTELLIHNMGLLI